MLMLIQRFLLSSELDTDMTGIATVAAACGLLQTGTRRIDELWPGDIPDESVIACDANAFLKAQAEFWKLKRAVRALDDLRTSLHSKMRPFERAINRSYARHGIQRLPTEILRRIIVNTYELSISEDDIGLHDAFEARERVRKLALVNRQFRDLLYDLPQCFSDVGHEEYIDVERVFQPRTIRRLSKCSFSNLDVRLRPETVAIAEDFHTEIVGLRVHDHSHLSMDGHPFLMFNPSSKLLKLTSLTLDVRLIPAHDDAHMVRISEILSLVVTPSLRKLSIYQLEFLPHMQLNMLSELTVTSLAAANAVELFNYLMLMPLLTKLNFRISIYRDIDSNVHMSQQNHLPQLKYLKVGVTMSRVENSARSAEWLAELTRSIKAPMLQSFSLSFSHPYEWSSTFWRIFMTRNLFAEAALPTLRYLNLDLNPNLFSHLDKFRLRRRLDVFLSNVLAHLPKIEEFTFSFPSTQIFTGFNLFTKLRHLHLRSLDKRHDNLEDVENALVAILDQDESNLETIRFTTTAVASKSSIFEPVVWNQRLERRLPAHLNVILS